MRLPLSYAESVHRLAQYRPWESLNQSQACSYLQHRLVTYQLLHLYKTLFPQAWSESNACFYRRECAEDEPGELAGHSRREVEFLETLGQTIPISNWTLEACQECRLEGLPILDLGIDIYGEGELEHLGASVQILLPFSEEGRHFLQLNGKEGQEWYESSFDLKLSEIHDPSIIPPNRLQQRFNRLDPPLRFLPLILRMIGKTTGNIWLDSTNSEEWYGSGCTTIVDWTVGNMQSLMIEWKRAQKLIDQCQTLTDWLEVDLMLRFNQILAQWNQPYA